MQMEKSQENEMITLERENSGGFSTKKYGAEIEDEIPLYIFDILLTERKSRLVVKFTTRDGGIFAQCFLPNTDFEYIKSIAAAIIQVKPRRMRPNIMKLKLTKHEQINEFKNDPHDALPCMITPKEFMEKLTKLCDYEELVIPDYICVAITDSVTHITRCVPVEVYNRAIDKPWDGGYRNLKTGLEFHNAFSQTGPRPPVRGPDLMNSRDTQTSWCRNRKLDMSYSQATQMCKNDLFVPCITDRILTPRPYESSEERQRRLNIEAKIRTIQRYFRSWKMRRCLKLLHAEYEERKMKELARKEAELEDDRRRRRKDLICQVFPKSRIDFSMLHAIANKWKQGEISKISAMYCGPAKVAEMALLSDKEVEVFRAIEKLQQVVKTDARKQKELSYLRKLGKPTKWYCSYKYLPVELDSLENQRAREIDTLYQKVVDRSLSEPKRMDALFELKLSLRNDDCEIAIELNKLIERALNLLSRGFSNRKIEVLQRRIDSAMLYHFKQKECFDFLTAKQEETKKEFMKKNLFVCQRCEKMKTLDLFKFDARTQQINICNACRWLDRTVEPWADLSPYHFILEQIRKMERLNNSPSSVAYILQDEDIYHLVTSIWHSHSAISECQDIYDLRMLRWNKNENWSPWNCILLTLEEGRAHLKIENLEGVYEEEFINHIFNKHALAKIHFKDLISIERRFKSLHKISSVDNLDPNGYNDFRKIFKIDRSKRLYFH